MGVRFLNNPFDDVVKAFETLYPDKECMFVFQEEIAEGYGCTLFPDDGDIPVVEVSAKTLSYFDLLEITAHELAHVAVGETLEHHGKEWEKAFSAIHEKYAELAKLRATTT